MSSNLQRNKIISHLCDEILSMNESLFFVASLTRNGRAIESKLCNDRIISKMAKQETEMLFMQRSLQVSLGMEFDDVIGPLNSIIIQRETFLEFIFPYSEGIFLAMGDLKIIPNYLAKKISFMLRNFEYRLKIPICE